MSDSMEEAYAAACKAAEYTDDGFNWIWEDMPEDTRSGFSTFAAHLRRKHRQELLDELIEVAQVNQLTIDGFGGPDILADWLTEWKMDED